VRLRALLLLLVACGGPDRLPFEAAAPGVTPEPSKRGPFPVGVRTVTFEDTGRKKLDGSPRILVTEIWYPATQASRGGAGTIYDIKTYFTEEQQAALGEVPVLETDAVRDAPIARSHGPFPLVMFSHGQAALRWQSTYLTVLLASHGYVVASPDHEGGTLFDVVRGQLAGVTDGLDNRPLDLKYLVNRLSRMPKGDALESMVDVDRLGVAGHSFGALTAMRATVYDERVKAICPQAPVTSDLAYVGHSNPPPVPMMLQGAKLDRTLPYDENTLPAYDSAKGPKWLLAFETGGHFTFSDLCQFDLASLADRVKLDIPGADVKKVLQDGCGPEAPPAAVALPMINHFAVAFFNAQLRGSAGSSELLTQTAADAFDAGIAEVRAAP
jgi:predicted dienelactone hydrolase